MNALSPQQIVGGLNRREAGARNWIYKEYVFFVSGMAWRMTRGSRDAEDLTQDIFTRLFGYQGRFESLEKVRHFLNSTTRNLCLDYLKHRQVVISKSEEIADQYFSEAVESPAPLETMSLYSALICEAMEKLPPQSGQVFRLWYTEELSNAEIAKRMHMSEKTVANHKSKALKFLKVEVLKMSRFLLLLISFFR